MPWLLRKTTAKPHSRLSRDKTNYFTGIILFFFAGASQRVCPGIRRYYITNTNNYIIRVPSQWAIGLGDTGQFGFETMTFTWQDSVSGKQILQPILFIQQSRGIWTKLETTLLNLLTSYPQGHCCLTANIKDIDSSRTCGDIDQGQKGYVDQEGWE